MQFNGLYTDYYELSMAQAFFLEGRHQESAVFDYYFRKAPFEGSYAVFAGTQTLIDAIEAFNYDQEAIDYLESLGFQKSFLKWLSGLRINISVNTPPEGTIVFPNEPIAEISGPLSHCLLLETLVLNILNFESLIATKASRMKSVMMPNQKLIDFGLRRAQGFAGFHASRAAAIGGCDSSSNVISGMIHGHPVGGTHAHAWIQSFTSEIDAFRTFAKTYPDSTILLVDTYDTLKSGIPNAIKVGLEMKRTGHQLQGVRLDSGEFKKLIPLVRKQLDEAGLSDVSIVISDNIDEFKIEELNKADVRPDVFGVGTRLITAYGGPALNGVYKMSSLKGKPVIKRSDDSSKITLPGPKRVYRYVKNGQLLYDEVVRDNNHQPADGSLLRAVNWRSGSVYQKESLNTIASRLNEQKLKLDPAVLRLHRPEAYDVRISPGLKKLQQDLLNKGI